MTHGPPADPVQHINDKHGDDLLAIGRAFGGHPDVVAAQAEGIDSEGIDLVLETDHGVATARVNFAEPFAESEAAGLRVAFVRLARRARIALALRNDAPNPS